MQQKNVQGKEYALITCISAGLYEVHANVRAVCGPVGACVRAVGVWRGRQVDGEGEKGMGREWCEGRDGGGTDDRGEWQGGGMAR